MNKTKFLRKFLTTASAAAMIAGGVSEAMGGADVAIAAGHNISLNAVPAPAPRRYVLGNAHDAREARLVINANMTLTSAIQSVIPFAHAGPRVLEIAAGAAFARKQVILQGILRCWRNCTYNKSFNWG